MRRFFSIFKDERAATAVEYAMIMAMVFLAMVGAVTQFGQSTIGMCDYVANEVTAH